MMDNARAIDYEQVRRIDSEEGLFAFLREELHWPTDDTPDAFDFFADELDLNDEAAGKIGRVCQLANFAPGQPWGIFLVQFEGGHIYKSALRRVLRGLSEKRKKPGRKPARMECAEPAVSLHAELPGLCVCPVRGGNAHPRHALYFRVGAGRRGASDALRA